jgi:hypothetical protein
MVRVTLYLDRETEALMRAAARTAGVSPGRWVAELIRERTAREWPESVRRLAGAWPDFPTAEELRARLPGDAPREPL